MNQLLSLLCALLFIYQTTDAQDPELPVLQNAVGVSPNAAALSKNNQSSESLSTGAVTVHLPLEGISGRQLSVPVSLNYISSGIRVNEIESWVGLGWNLMAGGVITRDMQGLPDEKSGGYLSNKTLAADSDPDQNFTLTLKKDLANGFKDMMPDFFTISSFMTGGSFIFGNDGLPHAIPAGDILIETHLTSQEDNSIQITLSDGTMLIFGGPGATEESSVYFAGPDPVPYTSAWYLSQVISSDKTDTISFFYSAHSYSYPIIENVALKYFTSGGIGTNVIDQETVNESVQYIIQNAKVLDSIVTVNGKIDFITSSSTTGNYNVQLDQIEIYRRNDLDNDYTLIDGYDFQYSGTGRMFLQSVKQLNLPAYQFTYNQEPLPVFGSVAQDHWGYYNGETGNENLLPAFYFSPFQSISNDRDAHNKFTQAGLLQQVKNPLGGITKYFYESNTIASGEESLPWGGLRVYRTETVDPASNISHVVSYKYTDQNGRSSGVAMRSVGYVSEHEVVDANEPNPYHCTIIQALQPYVGSNPGSPVMYQEVTRFEGTDRAMPDGKTVFEFLVFSDNGTASWPYVPFNDRSWKRGYLYKETVYGNDNGSFHKRMQRINNYDLATTEYTIKGKKVGYNKLFLPSYNVAQSADFEIASFSSEVGFPNLQNSTTMLFDSEDETIFSQQETDYFYDNLPDHHMLTRTQTTDSQGRSVTNTTLYPVDFPYSGIHQKLVDHFMINVPLVQKTYLNMDGNEFLTHIAKTEFQDYTTGSEAHLYPYRTYEGVIGTPIAETNFSWQNANYVEYDYDDFGNMYSSLDSHGSENSRIFLNNGRTLVGHLSNGSSGDVAFTSFEFSDHWKWVLTGGTVSNSDARTGSRSFDLTGGGEISATGFDPGTYLISYWQKGTTLLERNTTVLQQISLETVSGWERKTAKITIASSGDMITISGSGLLDEVRLHPFSTSMTTQSINSKGLISDKTDATGKTTFLEYDQTNTLSVTRDNKRNIRQIISTEYAENE